MPKKLFALFCRIFIHFPLTECMFWFIYRVSFLEKEKRPNEKMFFLSNWRALFELQRSGPHYTAAAIPKSPSCVAEGSRVNGSSLQGWRGNCWVWPWGAIGKPAPVNGGAMATASKTLSKGGTTKPPQMHHPAQSFFTPCLASVSKKHKKMCYTIHCSTLIATRPLLLQ